MRDFNGGSVAKGLLSTWSPVCIKISKCWFVFRAAPSLRLDHLFNTGVSNSIKQWSQKISVGKSLGPTLIIKEKYLPPLK